MSLNISESLNSIKGFGNHITGHIRANAES